MSSLARLPHLLPLLCVLSLAPFASGADEPPAAAASSPADAGDADTHSLWLTSGFLSHHTGQSTRYHYNQHNDGVGVEWHESASWQFNAGHYRNSVRHGSTYLQAAWMPLGLALGEGLRLKAGASLGVINGYPKVEHGRYFPTLVPALALESRRFGLNLVYIPSVGKKVDGALALQLKLRVF
jgi:hypothetical protein